MENTFTNEVLQALYIAVDALPASATETAKKEITRKGYDTTGYQYQYLVNVLNEVIGVANWGFTYTILKEEKGSWSNGKPFYELTVEMTVTILGASRTCVGGHKSEAFADAMKGAITNSLKKTLGMFGVGKKAYEGTIDEDYRPVPIAEAPRFTEAHAKAIASITSVDALKTYWEANKGLGADFGKAVVARKAELTTFTDEDIAPVPEPTVDDVAQDVADALGGTVLSESEAAKLMKKGFKEAKK